MLLEVWAVRSHTITQQEQPATHNLLEPEMLHLCRSPAREAMASCRSSWGTMY